MTDIHSHLDPASFPKKLDLILSAELESELSKRAARSGRTIGELIVQLLDQAIHSNPDSTPLNPTKPSPNQ